MHRYLLETLHLPRTDPAALSYYGVRFLLKNVLRRLFDPCDSDSGTRAGKHQGRVSGKELDHATGPPSIPFRQQESGFCQ